MQRIQLALNVTDIAASVDYYAKLFDTAPAKVRDGYANFAIDEPPLKLVLIEGATGGSLNHLGVEVGSTEVVGSADSRLSASGLTTRQEQGVECCYARQDKIWTSDPDGAEWEIYTVLGDSTVMTPAESACC